jgi:hypothetical protein
MAGAAKIKSLFLGIYDMILAAPLYVDKDL